MRILTLIEVGLLAAALAGCEAERAVPVPPTGDVQSADAGSVGQSVTFHITNTTSQTLYVQGGGGLVTSAEISPADMLCAAICGECAHAMHCDPGPSSVIGVGAGQSYDVTKSGQVWTWRANGCGEDECGSASASRKSLTALVYYSTSYVSAGQTVVNGAAGEFFGEITASIASAPVWFDFPQSSIVEMNLH
jgi:hypothetical protein